MSGVVVVGGGLAGTVAAARIHSLGVPVQVIADRPGATAMHGGGWYLGIAALARLGVPTPRIGEALAFVSAGLPELALEDGPFVIPDAEGAPRLVDVAPASHAAASRLPHPFAVIDLEPLGHPFACMVSAEGAERVAVDYPRWPGCFGRSFAAAAGRLEADPAERERLEAALVKALKGRGLRGVLLPPILGVGCAGSLRAQLESALGVVVAESLDCLPSTPGLRLTGALRAWLDRLDVRVRLGRVTGLTAAEPSLRLGTERLRSGAVILATGGVISGGLEATGGLREPLGGLRIAPELPSNLAHAVNPGRPYGQALFRAGLATDAHLRPIWHDGAPVGDRVFAAGDLVGGPDGVKDRCGAGRALLTGYLAGEFAARALS